MKKILMIEDDAELAEILSEFLEAHDMSVTVAQDPYIGISTLNLNSFDLVILDLTLPGIDGLEVCKQIRARHNVPIMISSARHDITDKVNALENGADDYLPKPYDPEELLARIRSHLRRVGAQTQKDEHHKDIILNEHERNIYYKGVVLNLTAAEYDILRYLINKNGGVVSREELIYNCDSISEDSTSKSIDVMIGRIRVKLGENPKEPHYIHAVRGVGYRLSQ
ncbi:response regulator transcription factor [Campylobacter sp. 19-13652]|uniref:response regulator transcription factor n=1 Tax=Campylobacter sp. 19-13652 TaxID=2840180 RepID=UPI001C766CDD|nr:response regulator transcription factor [Campylobacter sp. 19-13652]BCX79310.1 DNA-binding response regulator [Campylobacter sp. 19-13652]